MFSVNCISWQWLRFLQHKVWGLGRWKMMHPWEVIGELGQQSFPSKRNVWGQGFVPEMTVYTCLNPAPPCHRERGHNKCWKHVGRFTPAALWQHCPRFRHALPRLPQLQAPAMSREAASLPGFSSSHSPRHSAMRCRKTHTNSLARRIPNATALVLVPAAHVGTFTVVSFPPLLFSWRGRNPAAQFPLPQASPQGWSVLSETGKDSRACASGLWVTVNRTLVISPNCPGGSRVCLMCKWQSWWPKWYDFKGTEKWPFRNSPNIFYPFFSS